MLRLRVFVALAAVLGVLAASSRLTADEKPKPKESKKQCKPEKKIPRSRGPVAGTAVKTLPHGSILVRAGADAVEKALEVPVAIGVEEQPLADVVDYLSSHANVAIVLDNRALCDLGVSGDTPVTLALPRLPLRSALDLMLRDFALTWVIQDGVLLITTPEKAEEALTTAVLDVSDLVVCRDAHDALWDDYDTLIDAVTSTVFPMSWEDIGGPGSVRGASFGGAKVLVVAQTQRAHEEIAKLLAGIRAIAKKNPNAAPPRRDRNPPKEAKTSVGSSRACPPAAAAKPAPKAAAEKKPGFCPCHPPRDTPPPKGGCNPGPAGPPPKTEPQPKDDGNPFK